MWTDSSDEVDLRVLFPDTTSTTSGKSGGWGTSEALVDSFAAAANTVIWWVRYFARSGISAGPSGIAVFIGAVISVEYQGFPRVVMSGLR
jgi:hypothetical protein